MISDVIVVSSTGSRMEAALREADKIAAYKGLSPKGALHLRLLIEEMMGMMRSITGETSGSFWVEEHDGDYWLHLKVETAMTSEKRENLLAASTSGRNESARGLMGRLRDFFDRGADADLAGGVLDPMMAAGSIDVSASPSIDWEWSMLAWQDSLTDLVKQEAEGAKEMWDELEKSVVAHVADEVKVSIRGAEVEMVIQKKLA